MKRNSFLMTLVITALLNLTGCGSDDASITQPTPPSTDDAASNFIHGADISWYTEMAAAGRKYYNKTGHPTECPTLMKELGMEAVRLRVWVNPENKNCHFCDKTDVLAKAVAAKAQGLDIMVDFHFSDWWADPGRQDKPAAWNDLEFSDLKQAVANHTTDVLTALKAAKVTPKWIQVGNETRNGMLHPSGQLWTNEGDISGGWENYAALSNMSYNAAKAVFADALILVHLNHAAEDNDWWFKKFKAAGGKFDMIGLSYYPQMDDESQTWQTLNIQAANNVQTLGKTYGVKVMITEVGVSQNNENLGSKIVSDFMSRIKQIKECAGAFYWEPEVYGNWKPDSYDAFGWNAYTYGAFTNKGRPSSVMDAFINN